MNSEEYVEEYAYDAESEPGAESDRLLWIGGGVVVATLLACVCILCIFASVLVYLDRTQAIQPEPTVPAQVPESTPSTRQLPQPVINIPPEAQAGQEVTFDGSQSLPGSSPIASYQWGLGDGNTAEGATVTHTYAQPAIYEVTLMVRGEDGSGNVATTQIVIRAAEAPVEPTPTRDALPRPVINFPPEAQVGEAVAFDGSQSLPGSSPIASYKWDFGDGNTGEGATVTHTYGQVGLYQVTLTVTGEDGLANTDTVQIVVREAATPGPIPPTSPGAGLVGPTWKWTELSQEGGQSAVPVPENYTLRFQENRFLYFQADCNSGSGTYLVDGDRLSLDLAAVSQTDCGPDSLSSQYLTLLAAVETFEFDDDRLVLLLAGGAGRMLFVP